MRVLILDTGLALDLARRLAQEGDEVYYYLNKIRNYPDESEALYGKGLFEEWGVKRIDMYDSILSYVDYVVATDIGYGKHLDYFRKKGTLVYGAPFLGERLETDREFGRETLAGYGVKVPEVTVHNTKEDAVQHIKQNPSGYAYKSDESRNKKTFVTKSPEAMIKFLSGLSSSAPIRLEKFIEGVEIACGGFFNGQEFLGPKLISFEYNKTFPGDLGPMNSEIGTAMYYDDTGGKAFAETLQKIEPFLRMVGYRGYVEVSCIANESGTHVIEFTCFDEKTEILTQRGWLKYTEVVVGDMALAINPQSREIEWKKIVGKRVRDYDGEMVRIGNKALDILVTPDHNLLITKSGKNKIVKAGEMPEWNWSIVRSGSWFGTDKRYIEIPEYIEEHCLGKSKKKIYLVHPARKLDTHVFMQFLGLYLSEGCFGGRRKNGKKYHLTISQSWGSKRRGEIEEILKNFGFDFSVQKNGGHYQINSRQLCGFLESLGLDKTASFKTIPLAFKNFSPRLLEALVHGFALGDGCWHKRNGQLSLYTTSKLLADDFQEVLFKTGRVANIKPCKVKGTVGIGGYTRRSDGYSLSVREKKLDYSVDKRVMGREHYTGKVWDVEVEDYHAMLVRRNGKAFFSGNCRFGYPVYMIQMTLHKRFGEVLSGIAYGTLLDPRYRPKWDILKHRWAIGTCWCVNGYPYTEVMKARGGDWSIVYGIDKAIEEGARVGFFGVVKEDGKYIALPDYGRTVCITGQGQTISQAMQDMNDSARKIWIPDGFYRYDIGARTIAEGQKLLEWGYVDKDWAKSFR